MLRTDGGIAGANGRVGEANTSGRGAAPNYSPHATVFAAAEADFRPSRIADCALFRGSNTILQVAEFGRTEMSMKARDGFPPLPDNALRLLRMMGRQTSASDISRLYPLYSALSKCHPLYAETEFETTPQQVVARQNGLEIRFPAPLPRVKFEHILAGYPRWLRAKYSLPGFVEPEPGDIVYDCGAFVGGFSMGAADVAEQLVLFEPAPGNAACAKENLKSFPTTVVEAGLFNETKSLTLNMSASSVEHSILEPDDGEVISTHSIQVYRLDDFVAESGQPAPTFLKVEAEGVETEIIEGLGDLRPHKIAVDVSPERGGESPAPEIDKILQTRGYETRQRGAVLFAKKN